MRDANIEYEAEREDPLDEDLGRPLLRDLRSLEAAIILTAALLAGAAFVVWAVL